MSVKCDSGFVNSWATRPSVCNKRVRCGKRAEQVWARCGCWRSDVRSDDGEIMSVNTSRMQTSLITCSQSVALYLCGTSSKVISCHFPNWADIDHISPVSRHLATVVRKKPFNRLKPRAEPDSMVGVHLPRPHMCVCIHWQYLSCLN